MSIGNYPEMLSQHLLAGIFLVGRWGLGHSEDRVGAVRRPLRSPRLQNAGWGSCLESSRLSVGTSELHK